MANSFYTRAKNPAIRRFDFTWRDDPRKSYPGSGWEAKTRAELDEVTWEQEYECNFQATLTGGCIPAAWARAAVDIDKYLGIEMTGSKRAALDIADRGNDLNAYASGKGRKVTRLEQWSGKNSDTGYSVQRAMKYAEEDGLTSFDYDADGMGGAAVHSDARLINEARAEKQAAMLKPSTSPADYFSNGTIGTNPYRGSEAVVNPERIVPGTKRKAIDLFYNRKAQTWYEGRLGCYNAWCARNGKPYDRERLVCIDGSMPLVDVLVEQLAQAQVKETMTGKIQIDKNPDDVSSPDLADAVLMMWAPRKGGLPAIGPWVAAMNGSR
jgi:hypothetical protein